MDRPKQYRQGAMLPERDQAACFWPQLKIIEQGSLAITDHLQRKLIASKAISRPEAPHFRMKKTSEASRPVVQP